MGVPLGEDLSLTHTDTQGVPLGEDLMGVPLGEDLSLAHKDTQLGRPFDKLTGNTTHVPLVNPSPPSHPHPHS